MSVSTTVTRVSYTVTTLPQTLTVPFAFNQGADLGVTDGATFLVLGGDYTVAGGGYNNANQLQTGTVVVVGTGPNAVQIGDVITIYRNILPVQTTSFASTGLQTPLMIEQDDDKLTTLIQESLAGIYNPFPPAPGSPLPLTLGWITAETGGTRTSIDSLNIVSVPTVNLPLIIMVSITDDLEIWKLRPMQVGDPNASLTGAYIVPIINPNSLIWVRIG